VGRDRLGKSSTAQVSLVPAEVTRGPLHPGTSGGIVVRLPDDVTIELGDISPAWIAELIRELARPS